MLVDLHVLVARFNIGKQLVYGQSITDACIGFEDSEKLLYVLSEAVQQAERERDDPGEPRGQARKGSRGGGVTALSR